MAKTEDKLILLDADVLIHFFKGELLSILPSLYPKRLLIADAVFNELTHKQIKEEVTNLLNYKMISLYTIPPQLNLAILKEIAQIRKDIPTAGGGESICMAIAKYDNKIIASSNIKDIKVYCNTNNIQYLTTMDILVEAYQQKKLDETECDYFIYNVKSKGSKLPCDTIKEYLEKK